MAGWPVPRRRDDEELMDAPGCPAAEVRDAYRVLSRVNRNLGQESALLREVLRLRDSSRPIRWLDVGSGGGDLPSAVSVRAARKGLPLQPFALDRDPIAAELSKDRRVASIRGDALRLPLADRSFDLVTAVKFAHHFHGPPLLALLSELARVARRRVVVLDLRRSWLAYLGFVLWSRVFTTNRLVRHDGPLSVLRGFTRNDLIAWSRSVSDFSWEVRGHPGFQLALVGVRHDS